MSEPNLKDSVIALGFFSSRARQGELVHRKDPRVREHPHAFIPALPDKRIDLRNAVVARQSVTHTDGNGVTRTIHSGQ